MDSSSNASDDTLNAIIVNYFTAHESMEGWGGCILLGKLEQCTLNNQSFWIGQNTQSGCAGCDWFHFPKRELSFRKVG